LAQNASTSVSLFEIKNHEKHGKHPANTSVTVNHRLSNAYENNIPPLIHTLCRSCGTLRVHFWAFSALAPCDRLHDTLYRLTRVFAVKITARAGLRSLLDI